ncbi:MAG: 30S ribosomal protein S20 [Thermodesulfobacteriota bacterium]
MKKRGRNNFVRTTLKTKTKSLLSAVDENDTAKANERLKDIISAFDKAATKGVIHKKNASRNISRFSKKVHNMQSGE